MVTIKYILCTLISFSVVNALNLPSYFKKCKKSDPKLNDCIRKNIVDNWQTFIQGDKAYHLQNMNPLAINFMRVAVDANLYGNLTKGYMTGFKEAQFREVKLDLDKKTLELEVFYPISSIFGNYDIYGKLLGLSVSDTGTVNVTFIDGLNKNFIKYELKDKKGKQYIQIVESNVDNEEQQRIYFDAEFQRNKLIGDSIKQVLNDNWKEVANEVRTSVGVAIGGIIKALLQPFFDKVPFDDFFAEE